MSKHTATDLRYLMDHPVFFMHDNTAKLIRAQLFFLSISTILLAGSGITMTGDSSILGIKVSGLTRTHMLWILVLLLLYQTLHFLWASWESFCEWRLRQSALDAGGWGEGGIRIADKNQSLKIRQTTLYCFMTYVLESDLNNLYQKISNLATHDNPRDLAGIEDSINKLRETLETSRIDDAIWRFDNFFRMFCKSQNWRWLILEMLLPIGLGVVAIVLSIRELICNP